MGLFTRKPERATAAQLGNAATPEEHTLSAVPPSIDVRGDDLPDQVSYAPREARSWRGMQVHAAPVGPASEQVTPADHAGYGAADQRRTFGGGAGQTGPAHETDRPAAEVNIQTPMGDLHQVNPHSAPERNRAGSTGADPARAARRPFAGFLRAFDQTAQYGPASISKLPIVITPGLPLTYGEDVAGAVPSPGGGSSTRMAGVGPQPNSFRLLPRAWDDLVVNTGGPTSDAGDPAVAATSARRASGWALR